MIQCGQYLFRILSIKKINAVKIRFKGDRGKINIKNLMPLIEVKSGDIFQS